MADSENPFLHYAGRQSTHANLFTRDELGLANRNNGTLLETLALDITPIGTHYLLNHFDVPLIEPSEHNLDCSGHFSKPTVLSLDAIKAMPRVSMPVTLECAGNGRARHSVRSHSMPWHCEGVGTSVWSGTRLAPLVKMLEPSDEVIEIVFQGKDFGYDKACAHHFARSLTLQQLYDSDAMLVYEMNGVPLLPQHGAPLRLIMPGWYGMMSVKWLVALTALTKPFDGFQQMRTYRYRKRDEDAGAVITTMRIKSLMIPPGVPDWSSRKRYLKPGPSELIGRAWSGAGVPISRVDVSIDGLWQEAELYSNADRYAWTKWQMHWEAHPGTHVLQCRATDADGQTQPLEAPWDVSGFGNNAVQQVSVFVDSK